MLARHHPQASRLRFERVDGRRVHTDMEMWTEIRRKVFVEGASKRSIRRDYRVSARTLEKILANAEPPGYRQEASRPKPVLGQFLGIIDEILLADRDAPAKQRHTAKRIFERLRDEHGYTGCSSQVRAQVARARKRQREVFVPLSHPPGEAQYDFGEATVIIAGEPDEGSSLGHDPALLGRVPRLGLPPRVHRDLPGRSRCRLRLLRRRPHPHQL